MVSPTEACADARLDLSREPLAALALALARAQRANVAGARVQLRLPAAARPDARDWLEGAGFGELELRPGRAGSAVQARAQRAHTLPDYVRPGLELLICGLNPSPHAARTGIPFGRPGNRFWPAALAADLAARDRDVECALEAGLGFTDLCKRTTPRAAELSAREFAEGVERVRRLVARQRPRRICLVGLGGWRQSVDRAAQPGWQPARLAGVPTYLMPSTSGLNARASVSLLAAHLRAAARG